MVQQLQPDLSVYAKTDPDNIYIKDDGTSLTFIYTPQGNMYVRRYPETHEDMLNDENIFREIFPYLEKLPKGLIHDFLHFGSWQSPRIESALREILGSKFEPQVVDDWIDRFRKIKGSRGKALNFSRAVLGRAGNYQGDLLLSFWPSVGSIQDALKDPKFIAPIQKAFGDIDEMIVVGAGTPKFWSEIQGKTPTAIARQPRQSAVDTQRGETEKTYQIDGQEYTKADLGRFRGVLHSGAKMGGDWAQANKVLCSPDLLKYPELKAYRPAACEPVAPPVNNWLDKSRELYSKGQTGMLYPSWRAHSESFVAKRSFKEYLKENDNGIQR